ncbi:MAG TPA: DUF3892 domain-containing protein [Bryobacteraceae bacterium]|jgi:hypothetical protein
MADTPATQPACPEYEITCVNKPDNTSSHEQITHIGNTMGDWRMECKEAIRRIAAKEAAFYTVDRATNLRVYLHVFPGDGLHAPYLRAYADGEWKDNLLNLDSCSRRYCKLIR